jgi:hypothetical protein
MMRCSVCDALHREKNLACEVEAAAVLQQRYEMIRPYPVEADLDQAQQRQETVVSSRRKQWKIESQIQEHRSLAHSV